MQHTKRNAFLLLIGDILLLYAALWLTILIKYITGDIARLGYGWEIHKVPFTVMFALWLLLFFMAGLYEQDTWSAGRAAKERIVRTMIAAGIIAALLFYLVPELGITPRTNLLFQTIFSLILIMGWRIAASVIISHSSKTNVLFFGVSQEVLAFTNLIEENPHLGYTVATIADTEERAVEEIQKQNIHLVVASRDIRSNKELVHMLYAVLPRGIHVTNFPAFYEAITGKIPVSLISEVWFLENLIGAKRTLYEVFKRLFDVFLALSLSIVLLILLPFIAVGIICSTPREVYQYRARRARPGDGVLFFRQKRVGKNGALFNFVKFRSQRLGAERIEFNGIGTKEMEHDPRQYLFGKFLRAFYVDEIPQLWNVLKGEMSFIGPRPERPEYVKELKEAIPFYEMRLLVPPGITGWAQINMENDASVEDAPEKMQYDLYYIKNRSIALDVTIALKTILVMLSRAGR